MDNCCIARRFGTQFVPVIVCFGFFLLGLPIVGCSGGILIFTVFQDRSSNSLILICMLELFLLFWISTYRFFKMDKVVFAIYFNDSWFTIVLRKMGMGLAGNGENCQYYIINYIINGLKIILR